MKACDDDEDEGAGAGVEVAANGEYGVVPESSVGGRGIEARFNEAERPDIGGGGSGLLRLVLGAKPLKSSRLIVVVLRKASRLRSHRTGGNWRQSGFCSCA